MDANAYAHRLADTLRDAAAHRHLPSRTFAQGPGEDEGSYAWAFDVEICDSLDLRSGYVARVVITVGPQ